MKKIVIAGANSFVASNFVHELLNRGYHVIGLVRKNDNGSAKQRMSEALADTTLEWPSDSGKLSVYEYKLLEDDFFLAKNDLKEVFDKDIEFFHFAANLKFDHHSKEEIFETNINGLENALEIFHTNASKKSRFFFISTAYSCGKFTDVFKERFYPDQDIHAFRNYYEQSKRFAENVLQKYLKDNELKAHIIRLSQVVGNSQTGVTRTNYGIFDFARRIYALSAEFPHQSLRIRADPDATQNLIPIDKVVFDLISVIEHKDELPSIMNFVSKSPMENRKIIQTMADLLPIELIPVKNIKPIDMNPLEQKILAGMAFTGSYIDTVIKFDTSERDKVISDQKREVNETSVFAMLAYFMDQISEVNAMKE